MLSFQDCEPHFFFSLTGKIQHHFLKIHLTFNIDLLLNNRNVDTLKKSLSHSLSFTLTKKMKFLVYPVIFHIWMKHKRRELYICMMISIL